jgi:L-amino acid N-acyltransferase YncA
VTFLPFCGLIIVYHNRMTEENYYIDKMKESDWEQVRLIFVEGISTGNATLETEAPDWEKWNSGHLALCRLVARSGESILGWAALSPVSSRRVYSGVAEVSVYISEKSRGKGVGKALMEALVSASEIAGIWTLQSGILAENRPSIELHKKIGFTVVGRRERIGKLKGRWRDVIVMERRSNITGID